MANKFFTNVVKAAKNLSKSETTARVFAAAAFYNAAMMAANQEDAEIVTGIAANNLQAAVDSLHAAMQRQVNKVTKEMDNATREVVNTRQEWRKEGNA